MWGYGGTEFREQEESDAATLVESFAVLCRGLADRLEVDIFFDGRSRPWPRPVTLPENLRVRFAWEEEADDLILDRVRSQSFNSSGRATVVTGDSELGRRAQEEGGRWLRLSEDKGLEGILRSIERRFLK